ncbi:MAG: cation diffusion facilitator family transporter [Thermoplasmatota archaeon]
MEHVHEPDGVAEQTDRRRLLGAMGINATIVLLEAAGWWRTGSLALIADAGHNLTDVGALVLAYVATALAHRAPTSERSFGHFRYEIIAALVNGIVLVIVSIGLLVGAVERLANPPAVSGYVVLPIAVLALLGNAASAALLVERRSNLNIRAAFVHLASDALSAVSVIVAGMLIILGVRLADPVATIVIAFLIIASGWGILREAVEILLQSVPEGIEMAEVREALVSLPRVRDVHDLHIWSLAPGRYVATLHVVVDRATLPEADAVIDNVAGALEEKFGIHHTTVQIESG